MTDLHTKFLVNEISLVVDFKCAAEQCIDTCCKDFKVEVDRQSKAIYENYLPSINEILYEQNDRYFFISNCKSGCVNLKNGLCSIQSKVGDSALADQCYFYPRIVHKVGENILVSAALSCPVIAESLVTKNISEIKYSDKKYKRLPSNINQLNRKYGVYHNYRRIHEFFLKLVIRDRSQIAISKMLLICNELDVITPNKWYDNILIMNQIGLQGVKDNFYNDTDQLKILQLFVLLLKAVGTDQNSKLLPYFIDVEDILGLKVDFDTAEIIMNQDAFTSLSDALTTEHLIYFNELLDKWTNIQLINMYFPYAGIGDSFIDKAKFLAVRFMINKMFLYAALRKSKNIEEFQKRATNVIYLLSRNLDHIDNMSMLEVILRDYGWNNIDQLITILKNI